MSPIPADRFPTSWRTVAFGASSLAAGAVVLLAGVLALSALVAFNSQLHTEADAEGLGSRAREVPSISVVGCLLILFSGAMLCLAGLCLLCVAPAESGTRPLAAGAAVSWFLFLLIILQVPLTAVGIRLRPPPVGAEGGRREGDPIRLIYGSDAGLALAGALLATGASGFTLSFVCAVGHRFQNESLAQSARRLLLYQILVMPALLFLFVLHHALTESWPNLAWYWIAVPFGSAILAIPGLACVWFMRVLAEMRRMLRTAEEIANEPVS